MKISGAATLTAPPAQVWDAFHDPGVLSRCLPGCESLTPQGEHEYAMTVTAGVAAIKGTYDGQVALRNQQHPESFTLSAKGAGAPGTVDADVLVRLVQSPTGGTELTFDADAAVGGVIGGVGQRMLAGVTKKMAGQFFNAVDADIAGFRKPEAAAAAAAAAGVAPAGVPTAAPAPVPTAFGVDQSFMRGATFGAVVALAGVLVGAAVRGRR
jgi:uncharacterized protein